MSAPYAPSTIRIPMNADGSINTAKFKQDSLNSLKPSASKLPSVPTGVPGPVLANPGYKPSALATFWDSATDKFKDIGSSISDKVSDLVSDDDSAKYGGHDYTWWRDVLQGSSSGGSSEPQTFDYLDAPWASAYGMSKETAYNEAMTNTEYRRAVKDMQAAGLNPAVIFGAGRGSTAGVPGYISSSSPGGGGGGGGRYGGRSARSQDDYLFSGSAYSVLSVLGGIAGAAITKSGSGYWIGTSILQGAMHAASTLHRLYRR